MNRRNFMNNDRRSFTVVQTARPRDGYPPFDQTCVNQLDINQPGCNDGLGKCAEIVRQLASKYHVQLSTCTGQ
jgi:hypothetical protein